MSLLTSWSYTALTSYENCPRRYQLEKILKVLPFEESEAMKDGNIQHKHLEDRVADGTPLPPHLQNMESFLSGLEQKRDLGQLSSVHAELELVLDKNMAPVAPYGQTSPKPFFMKNAWLRSKLDLIVLNQHASKALVYDYKFGKFRPDNDQLELFAGIVFKYLPSVEVVGTGFIYPRLRKTKNLTFFRDGCTSADERASEKSEADIWSGWVQRVYRLESAIEQDRFPCKPSGLCGWCPATKAQCKFSKK